jgi:hypothetical protein
VQICRVNSLTQILDINKSTGTILLGTCSNNKGLIHIGGETLQLYTKEKTSMYLSNLTYSTNFSFNNSSIEFVNIDSTNKHYKNKPISLPYGSNVSYKTTFILNSEKYYNKSLLFTNASPEFD